MNGQLAMFGDSILPDTPSATSSPAGDSGVLRSGMQDGPMIDLSGLEVALAPVSAQRAKAQGLQTLVTSGLIGSDSSASASLQQSLESRLRQRLDMAGSTLFKQTWKRRRTPLGRSYLEHTASGRRTSGSGFTSVPTPQVADMSGGGQAKRALESRRPSGAAASSNLNDHAMLASVPTPVAEPANGTPENFLRRKRESVARGNSMGIHLSDLQMVSMLATVPTPMAGSPATETYNAAGNSDYSRRIVELATVATPQQRDHFPGHTDAYVEAKKQEGHGMANLNDQVQLATVSTPRSEDSESTGAHRGKADTLHSQTQLAAVSSPSAWDWKDTAGMSESGVDPDGSIRSRLDQLPRQAQLAASGETATGGMGGTASTGQLDPAYSRWLMGVKPAWDGFVCTATESLSRRRRSSSKRTSKPPAK